MLARRLTLSLLAALGAALLLTGFLLVRNVRTYWINDLEHSLIVQARLVSSQISATEFNGPDAGIRFNRLARTLGADCGCRVTFVRLDGTVIGDTRVPDDKLAAVENHRSRPEIQAAIYGNDGSAVRRSRTVNTELLYTAVPLVKNGEPAGIVRFAVPLDDVDDRVSGVQNGVITILLVFFLAAAGLVVWVSRSFSRPIDEMADVAGRLSNEDYSARFLDPPKNEMGRLAGTLNQLAEKVQTTVRELSDEKSQLSSILSNMVEAVVAVDKTGRILALNPALSDLFRVVASEAIGQPVYEILRNGPIEKLIQKTLETGEIRQEEIRIYSPEDRLFDATSVPLLNKEEVAGALLVFHDITRIRQLEQVRTDFVANVSHELRTPLAAIKGFAETLEAGGIDDKKNRMEFLSAITRHVDRMTRLVEELLELSAIESGSLTPKKEPVSLSEIISETVKGIKPVADQNGLLVESRPGSNHAEVVADPFLVRQVLSNLIENAVKFSLRGGKIEVWSESQEGFQRVFVKDTGIGIPENHLPRIFERFYRVDKARSRELGGTGLGLSIARHIVEAHGGRIGVESDENRGSTFWFDLPLT